MVNIARLHETFRVHTTVNGTFKLIEDFEFKGVVIPKGEETNGGNIPKIFRGFILPFSPSLLMAYATHDYLCRIEEYKKADRVFYKLLNDLGVKKWKRRVLYRAVRVYHKFRYGE